MVTIKGENDQVRKLKGKQIKGDYLPIEMWHEIISRLPFKALFRSQSVCKSWRVIVDHIKMSRRKTPNLSVPLCGLLISTFSSDDTAHLSYLCVRTGKRRNIILDSSDHGLVVSSGYEKGLLADSVFDFSPLNLSSPCNPRREFVYHGGLLLVTRSDGTCLVHNPATNKSEDVPKSKFIKRVGFKHHKEEEKTGMLIKYTSGLGARRCYFMVVRFCLELQVVESYLNSVCVWRKFKMELDTDFYHTTWSLRNCVIICKKEVRSIFILTDIGYGVATVFVCCYPWMKQYSFPLPLVVRSEEDCNANKRIWECEKSLYLSAHNATGLWIWKAVSTQANMWQWKLLFEISNTRQLCKPVAFQHLGKHVLNADARAMVLTFHPNAPVVFLLVKASILAYDLTKDTIESITTDTNEQEYSNHVDGICVSPFEPCLSFFKTLQERDNFKASLLLKRKSEGEYEMSEKTANKQRRRGCQCIRNSGVSVQCP